jgi:hypothetical protein
MTQGYAGKFWLWSSFRLIKEEALTVMPSQGCEVFTRLKTPVWEGFHTTHFCWKMGMVGLFLGYWVATGFTTRRNLEKLARQRFKTFQPQKPLRLAGEIPAVARSLKIPWYPQCIASKKPCFLAWRKQSDPICNHFEQVYEFSTSTRRRLEPKWSQRSRRPWASVVLLLGGTFVRRIHRGSLDFHRGST